MIPTVKKGDLPNCHTEKGGNIGNVECTYHNCKIKHQCGFYKRVMKLEGGTN